MKRNFTDADKIAVIGGRRIQKTSRFCEPTIHQFRCSSWRTIPKQTKTSKMSAIRKRAIRIRLVTFHIADVKSNKVSEINTSKYKPDDFLISRVDWSPDSNWVIWQGQNREQTYLDLNASARNGKENKDSLSGQNTGVDRFAGKSVLARKTVHLSGQVRETVGNISIITTKTANLFAN